VSWDREVITTGSAQDPIGPVVDDLVVATEFDALDRIPVRFLSVAVRRVLAISTFRQATETETPRRTR
jgi:hypothetical protein